MRYKETGNLHLDFHGATNTTINYLVDNYGRKALKEIFFQVGHDVYKSIRQNLAKGLVEELLEHWQYFFAREKGDFEIKHENGKITLTVKSCPAVNHVRKLGLKLSPHFCDQTIYVNEGLCHGTEYEIKTTKTGENSCRQVLQKTGGKAGSGKVARAGAGVNQRRKK